VNPGRGPYDSIIAKGVQSRLDKLREAIALLDVPAVGDGRMRRNTV
jgi:hypothetical protein